MAEVHSTEHSAMKYVDYSGRGEYGRWTPIRCVGVTRRHARLWLCRCRCGTEKTLIISRVVSGEIESCGCAAREATSKRSRTHGATDSPEWKAWRSMRDRCLNRKHPKFRHYGGRGIRPCAGFSAFANLLADLGLRPSPKHSLDRVRNDDGYWCGHCEECLANGWGANCRWADAFAQSRNRRSVRKVTCGGETLSVAEWAERTGISRVTIGQRLDRGWTPERALTTPPRGRAARPAAE